MVECQLWHVYIGQLHNLVAQPKFKTETCFDVINWQVCYFDSSKNGTFKLIELSQTSLCFNQLASIFIELQ
jgi:hypothetical protein